MTRDEAKAHVAECEDRYRKAIAARDIAQREVTAAAQATVKAREAELEATREALERLREEGA